MINMAMRYVRIEGPGHFPYAVKSADPETKVATLEYVGALEILLPDETVTFDQLATEWKEAPPQRGGR